MASHIVIGPLVCCRGLSRQAGEQAWKAAQQLPL